MAVANARPAVCGRRAGGSIVVGIVEDAPTNTRSHSRGADSTRSLRNLTPKRGSRECRVRAAPAVSCAKLCEKTHTSIQVQRKHSGIPRAMALRLMPCSPRRRIRLVTVAAGLMAGPIRLDRISHRQLDTSNGCRNHTVLPYALAPFVLRAVVHSRETRPANISRADAAASTASSPAFRDDHDTPLAGKGWGKLIALICPTG
jgi:hypothetical protein